MDMADCDDGVTEGIDIFESRVEQSEEMSENARKIAVSWVEKYRPKTIDDFVIEPETKKMLKEMVESRDIASISLYGSAGIGKTSLAKLLARSVDSDVLFIPCGTDGTVDVVRNRIQPFCESASSGRVKVIILDEFDSASGGNAAAQGMQKALRSLMEMFTDTRFIITCNYDKKIIEPIFSRCPKVHIGFALKDVALRLKEIWEREGVQYDKESAVEFMKKVAYPRMPDIRSIIGVAQLMCKSGKLVVTEDSQKNTSSTALQDFADKLVDGIKRKSDYRQLRQSVVCNTSLFGGDYEILASAMADSVIRKGYNPEAVAQLSEFAYRMSQVHDPALQVVGAIISLQSVL